jgi:hypothetical protein
MLNLPSGAGKPACFCQREAAPHRKRRRSLPMPEHLPSLPSMGKQRQIATTYDNITGNRRYIAPLYITLLSPLKGFYCLIQQFLRSIGHKHFELVGCRDGRVINKSSIYDHWRRRLDLPDLVKQCEASVLVGLAAQICNDKLEPPLAQERKCFICAFGISEPHAKLFRHTSWIGIAIRVVVDP